MKPYNSSIPLKLRKQMAADPFMKKCARQGGECSGRLTWEHCFNYGNRRVNEAWAIIPLCWHHHLGPGLDKFWNQRYAVSRATKEELKKYPRKQWSSFQ